MFAAIHSYWAAGGTGLRNSGETYAAAQAYIGCMTAVGLVGAAVGHGLERDWGARLGRRRLSFWRAPAILALPSLTAPMLSRCVARFTASVWA